MIKTLDFYKMGCNVIFSGFTDINWESHLPHELSKYAPSTYTLEKIRKIGNSRRIILEHSMWPMKEWEVFYMDFSDL